MLFYAVFSTIHAVLVALGQANTEQNNSQADRLNSIRDLKNDSVFYESSEASQLSLTYSLLLNITCHTSNDCILKNSMCNTYTNRCECDLNTIQENNRCQTLKCTSNDQCLAYFEGTVCMFGSCRCTYGLKANGRCVELDIGNSGNKLPDWAISLIAIGALVSGIFGGRSRHIQLIVQHAISILMLVLTQVWRNNNNNNNNNINGDPNQSNGSPVPSTSIIEFHPALLPQISTQINGNDYQTTTTTISNDNKASPASNQRVSIVDTATATTTTPTGP